MREIRFRSLFRGKLLDPKVWVEGNLLVFPDGTSFICFAVEDAEFLDKYEVDPATVGQYTGLNDKHGRMIFEGDIFIVSDAPKYSYVVEWEECGFAAFIDPAGFSANDVEVIGNIHDNPELLEEVT